MSPILPCAGHMWDRLQPAMIRGWCHVLRMQARGVIMECKRALRTANDYLLGEFTFADIAAAVMIQSALRRTPKDGK